MKRSLRLDRETLTELSNGELGSVAGGNQYSGDALTCPILRCAGGFTMPPQCYSFPWCE